MMKQQLYIKNEKGRYEPYKLPEPDVSDTVYRKINGKYVPIGKEYSVDFLTEGVWVVTARGCFASGKYLREIYDIDKVSDLQPPTIADIGAINQAAEYAIDELHKFEQKRRDEGIGISVHECYQRVIGAAIGYLMFKQGVKDDI